MKIHKIVLDDIDLNVYRNQHKYKKEWQDILDKSESYSADEFLKLNLPYDKKFDTAAKYGYVWVLSGNPESIKDELVAYHLELRGPQYGYVCRNRPEDLIEERTSWNDMRNYADELDNFIDKLFSYL